MSKAFTRESDDDSPRRVRARQSSGLPPGALNYVTEAGACLLREELDELLLKVRPRLLVESAAGETGSKDRLQEVEGRIQTLQAILREATTVPSLTETPGEVRFGATVTIRDLASGSAARYRIVGVDEAGLEPHWISWRSPLGAALLHATIGQKAILPASTGDAPAEILRIEIESLP